MLQTHAFQKTVLCAEQASRPDLGRAFGYRQRQEGRPSRVRVAMHCDRHAVIHAAHVLDIHRFAVRVDKRVAQHGKLLTGCANTGLLLRFDQPGKSLRLRGKVLRVASTAAKRRSRLRVLACEGWAIDCRRILPSRSERCDRQRSSNIFQSSACA